MTVIFQDKGDVAIFFGLGLMMFTELFYGVIQMNLYNNPENREWYNTISRKIKGMPRRIVFPIVWTALYIGIWIAMFLYYRNEAFPNAGYMIDTITLLFIANVLLIKTWAFIFFSLRRTTISLVMIVFIIVLSVIMTVLFGVHELWGSFVPFLLLSLWCCYALYLNAAWVYVEKYELLDAKRREKETNSNLYTVNSRQ